MSDDQIQSFVHGTNEYDFLESASASFPHFLIRHYFKKFKVPVFRHNMYRTGHEIYGEVFARDSKDGTFRFGGAEFA